MKLTRREMIGCSALAAAAFSPMGALASPSGEGWSAVPEFSATSRGQRAAVATVHPLATEAGLRMLRAGGNAADAAVAAGLMLAVVDGHNSGLGGGCFILARSAAGKIIAIDGRETAPAAAVPDMFIRGGKPDASLSQTGALAAGVPGAVAAYHRLSTELGTGRWAMAAKWAAEVAAEGFPLPTSYAARLRDEVADLQRFPASRTIFLREDGSPRHAGETLVQADLASTLQSLAVDGPDAFYRGAMAELTGRWMRDHGGIMTAEDFASYRVRFREPVRTRYHDYEIVGFPPPSSGGVHVAQILGMLQHFDLPQFYQNSPVTFYHIVAEAMRLAFADRAEFLGDPGFSAVPRGLIDPEYLRQRASLIAPNKRIPIVRAGAPPAIDSDTFGRKPRHTTHFTATDSQGNWIAITATVNTTFGSKVVVPGTGVVLNNQMDDFAIAPGIPNAFGLVGNAANAPAAGKRPLSSMSPTIVLENGQPVLTCGAAGGPRIINATTQILLRVLALKQSVSEALAAPRIHHQWQPDQILVEPTIDPFVRASLEGLGHRVVGTSSVATAQGIAWDRQLGFTAAAEPRLPGAAGAIND